MPNPVTFLHARAAGASLRAWRDQRITVQLSATNPATYQWATWTTWAAATTLTLATTWALGAWWAAATTATLTATGLAWRAWRHTLTLTTQPPWWVLIPAATQSAPAVAVLTVGAACGASTDMRLRTHRHTPMLAGMAATTALAATWAGAPILLITALAWVGYLTWCLRTQWASLRAAETTPPPDLPLDAAITWQRSVRYRHGRREHTYTTLERLLGRSDALADIIRKNEGLAGEITSGRVLANLPRGYKVLHDLTLPGAREANIDHLVIGPSGVSVIDTKTYGSATTPAAVAAGGTSLVVQTPDGTIRDLGQVVRQVLWATQAVSQALGVPAKAVLLVHRATIAPGLVVADVNHPETTMTVTDPLTTMKAVIALPAGKAAPLTGEQIRALTATARRVLTAADGTRPHPLPTWGPPARFPGAAATPTVWYRDPVTGHHPSRGGVTGGGASLPAGPRQ